MPRIQPRKRPRTGGISARAPRIAARKRRGIGRPAAGSQAVGRDALIERTCEMLTELPPNRITRAEVARHMNVDPSLIRYYFRDRSTLLVAAAERLVETFQRLMDEELAQSDMSADGRLRARVSALLKLNVSYPFFHRLLIDELVNIDSRPAQRFIEEITHRGVAGYGAIIDAGVKEGIFRKVNSAFLFLAVIGVVEFFVNGMPVLRIAMGKEFDERVIAARYREFICELLSAGLRTRQPP
jgi:TetR/AcrR family transcriptional regulator